MSETSPNWEKNKDLPYLETSTHDGYPYDEGFPREHRHGTFELITSWGERAKGATVRWGKGTASDPTEWDVSRCVPVDKKKSRLHVGSSLLDSDHVAGWQHMS